MDEGWFNQWLLARPSRDVLFRIVVWIVIALLTAWFASRTLNLEGAEYLRKSTATLLPVLNIVGPVTIALSWLALLFKDVEVVGGAVWRTGWLWKIGGVVRRTTGDLLLWMLGSFVTLSAILAIATLEACFQGKFTSKDVGSVAILFIILIGGVVVAGLLSVLVRRRQSFLTAIAPFARFLTGTCCVLLVYVVLAAGLLIWLLH